MPNLPPKLAIVAALGLALGACATKKAPPLPEAPPVAARPEPPAPVNVPGEQPAPVTSSIVPGSQEDLRAKAGTDTVLFAYDSYELDGEARDILIRHAQWLKANAGVRVTVEGHCDQRGTREYNLALGDRRANSAKNFLVAQGIPVTRISTISYGKERPVTDGTDEASMALNRRAVTVVTSR